MRKNNNNDNNREEPQRIPSIKSTFSSLRRHNPKYESKRENSQSDTDHDSLAFRQIHARKTCLIRRRAALTLISIYCIVGVTIGVRKLSAYQSLNDLTQDNSIFGSTPPTLTITPDKETKPAAASVKRTTDDGHDEKNTTVDYLSWEAIEQWGRRNARVWSPSYLSSTFSWCTRDTYGRARHNPTYRFENPTGLIYVKMPKAASTTLAGLVHRVALRVGQRVRDHSSSTLPTVPQQLQLQSQQHTACAFRNQHIKQAGSWYGNRNRSASLLMSSLRHPASRALSRVFFDMSFRHWRHITDDHVMTLLQSMQNAQYGAISKGQGGFQLQYTSLTTIPPFSAWNQSQPNDVICPECVQRRVQQVLDDYDIWLITERMEESIVVLQNFLNLDMGDMLVFSTNQGGKYVYQPNIKERKRAQGKNKTTSTSPHCLPLKKSFLTPKIQAYFLSREWRARNYGDYLLYAAVQASLNKTIERQWHNQTVFSNARQQYRKLHRDVTDACRNDTIFPCSDRGQDQSHVSKSNCYQLDEGCGYPCIDRYLLNQQPYPNDIHV